MSRFLFADLFAGIGGFHLAMTRLGGRCVMAAEIDRAARKAYEANYRPHEPTMFETGMFIDDVKKLEGDLLAKVPDFDVVCAGFPCFPRGTLILSKRGFIDISEVVVGDEVWTHKARWRRVTFTHGSRIAPTVEMRGIGPGVLTTTDEHPFFSAEAFKTSVGSGEARKQGIAVTSPTWTPAKDMAGKRWATPTDFQGIDMPALPEMVKDPEVFMWCMGRWIADEWTTTHSRANSIPLGERGARRNSQAKRILWCSAHKEADELEERLHAAGIAVCRSPMRTAVRFTKQSSELFDFMAPFGVGASGKVIPPWVLCAPFAWREALLKGFLSGDGCALKKRWQVTTVSKPLSVSLRLLAVSIGWWATSKFFKRPETCVIEGRTVNQKSTWTVIMGMQEHVTAIASEKHLFSACRKVTPTGREEEVWNFAVEEDESYVADGITVHNCQAFSQQGHRLGFDDPTRGNLFFDIMRIVDAKRPRALFLENVRNLVGIHGGATFARICEEIESRGYELSSKVVRATEHGLPQHRPRIYMVAFDRATIDVTVPFAFPEVTPLRITMDEVWGGRSCQRKIGYTLRVGGRGSPFGDRHNWDSYLVDGDVKRLGPLEGRRMMGFPDDHVLSPVISQAMKQLGNSVAVDVVQAIGASLTDYLDAHDRRTTVVSVNDMQTGAAETAHAI